MKYLDVIFGLLSIACLAICCIMSYKTGNEAEAVYQKFRNVETSLAENSCYPKLGRPLQEELSFLSEDLSVHGLHGYDQFIWATSITCFVGLFGFVLALVRLRKPSRS